MSNHISRAIREARLRAGISQEVLADRMKTSRSVISRLESPRYHGHSLSTLNKIAKALGSKFAILFGDKDVS